MKIGIIELMPKGHYTLVETVARIFLSDPANEVKLIINSQGAEHLSSLFNEFPGLKKEIYANYEDFNNRRDHSEYFDRIYIITLDREYKEILTLGAKLNLYIFIHNIDLWFNSSVKYKFYNIFINLNSASLFLYSIKNYFLYASHRSKIIGQIITGRGKFVVLNHKLKDELGKYISPQKIEVIPFSVFRNKQEKRHSLNKKIRICIPGLLSQRRRNYLSLFELISANQEILKDKVEWDLLGGLSYEESKENILIPRIEALKASGNDIHFYQTDYIETDIFVKNLSKADVILGNMNVELNKYSKYGKTKDTGIIYNMIAAAKPGLLPADYDLIEELQSSAMTYKDDQDLLTKIMLLINKPDILQTLNKSALANSQKFTPQAIYGSLITDKDN
jgi:hypothetical protein